LTVDTFTKEQTPRPGHPWRWTLGLLVTIAGYVVLSAALGRFPTIDEVFFKAPGREWATTGRFAAPELTGLPFLQGIEPPVDEVWFVHPPGYPFVFGLYTRLVGFGPTPCIVFDALIHGLLAFLTWLLTRRLGDGLPNPLCFLVAVAVLPLGVTTLSRPDELAMCLGMAGLLLLLRPKAGLTTMALSGLLFGLCAATFVGTALLLGIIGLTLLPAHSRYRATIVWMGVATSTCLAAIAPILVAHPGAYRQYLAHSAAHVAQGNFLSALFTHWEYEDFHRSITLLCVVVATVGAMTRTPLMSWRLWRKLWLGPALAIAVVALLLPNKLYYLWFVGPWMMAAAAITGRAAAPFAHQLLLRVAAVFVLAFYAIAVASFLRQTLTMIMLPPSQRLHFNADFVRQSVPPGSRVVTDHYWWSLAQDRKVYDRYFSQVRPEEIDYVVLIGDDASGQVVLSDVPALPPGSLARFELIHDNVNTQPPRLFGRPIPGASGFGAAVLRRTPSR
jgi:hypothetical protein